MKTLLLSIGLAFLTIGGYAQKKENNTMADHTAGYLGVPQAKIYYEVKGSGPMLILIPGANGDAVIFEPIRDLLCKDFKVVTFDRRGFSHSTLNKGYDFKDRLADDADDVAALIEHLSDDGSAYVLGSSSGAIASMKTLLRHPQKIKMLIPHEPPAIELLDDPKPWEDFFGDIYKTYKKEGMGPAMLQFVGGNIDEKDGEAMKFTETDPNSQVSKNSVFWFEHELPVYPYTKWTTADFKPFKDKMLLMIGEDSEGYMTSLANQKLSQDLGLDILTVPSGHLGYVMEPEGFAKILTKALLKQ